ncbi:MAG: glutaredoxin 3 [Flavobacteriales bacterium]|jgi:glutaredoxin 3
MSKIEINTRPGCGYCTHAKRLLTNKQLPFVEYNVYQQPEKIEQLHARTTARTSRTVARTYPQIFIGGKSIGGFNELLIQDKHGLLATLNRH